jgi:hypothetical protein
MTKSRKPSQKPHKEFSSYEQDGSKPTIKNPPLKSQPNISKEIAQLSNVSLALLKFARGVCYIAALFFFLSGLSAVVSPELIAQEALGEYTDDQLQMIRTTGAILIIGAILFLFSAHKLKASGTLSSVKTGALVAAFTVAFTSLGGVNAFTLALVAFVFIPCFIVAYQIGKLQQSKKP